MKYSLPKMRTFTLMLRFAVMAALVAILFTPAHSSAQTAAPAPAASAAAPANAAPAEAPKTEEEQEQAFLHAPIVQSIGKKLGLGLETTSRLFLGINFAIILLAIVIPLGRMMPKIIRKRSQTLRHDLQTAREATADAQARLRAVEAKLAGLDEEMKKFRAQVEQESLEDEKRIKATLVEESARIVAGAEQEIGAAVAHARRGLRNFAADLAIEHAEKQLKLTPETDRALIAEFVAGVGHDGAVKREKS